MVQLIVFGDRSEYHSNDVITTYIEGFQSAEAQKRHTKIIKSLSQGYLDQMINSLSEVDFSSLSKENKELLEKLVDGITSNNGRAIVGLTFLQLTVKSISPEQNIRLHKSSTSKGKFSWTDGISMRTIDKSFVTPFLREHNLIKLNADGIFMTRTLAENYPYTKLYKAKIQGPFRECLDIMDALENESMPAEIALKYFTVLLKNKSDEFKEIAKTAIKYEEKFGGTAFEVVQSVLEDFFNSTHYSARAYEIVMHGFMQAMGELGYIRDSELIPLSQMRNANKKHGNIGDIELKTDGIITESWDAKYGKPYLREELEELREKILDSPGVQLAGFVADSTIDKRKDVVERIEEIEFETDVEIFLLTFKEWLDFQLGRKMFVDKTKLGYRWLCAVVESFAQERREFAPIDEPCDEWLKDLTECMKNHLAVEEV